MRARRGQAVLAAVLFVLGLLIVVQLRAQSGSAGLQQLSSQDLTTLIANLNTRNGQLRTEVNRLETQLRDLESASRRGESNAGDLRLELRRLRLWAGVEPVRGRGVRVRFDGPITADAVNDVIDELRSAGAEALALEEVRIVPGSVVGGNPGGLSVEDTPLPERFVLAAIGDPTNLTSVLVRPGGVVARIQATDAEVGIDVEPAEALALPATRRTLLPANGRPRV
ncbi:MAG TPA: DUF881 domain-containing protein [Candidatus Limnocylindrales bacterium]|nr:DUF881 domain-containing protein [Candidatus Limnocylindrales bacterium]